MKKSNILLVALAMILSVISASFAQKQVVKVTVKDNTVVLYIARHGKTMLNTLDRVQGWADTPLTPQGVEVAEYLGLGLKDVPLVAAYSSDLGRARQTARIVLDAKGDKAMQVIENPGLRETNFGSYEGDLNSKMWGDMALYMHYTSADELFKEMETGKNLLPEALSAMKKLDKLGMAEDYEQVRSRGQKVLRHIAEKTASKGGGNVLVVSHGMAIGAFLSNLDSSGKIITGGHMGNASVSKVVYKDGKFTVESVGDMSYVEKGKVFAGKK